MMTLFPIIVVIGIFVVFMVRRRDSGKPKEAEATLTKKTENNGFYVYTFDVGGAPKTLQTRESYYAKLREGQTGMLAYRGKALLDFEPFDKR